MNTQVQGAVAAAVQEKKPTEQVALFDMNTKERFNPNVRDELISFIRVQMRSGEGIHKKLFGYVRACGDFSTATGTIHGAEKQVCKDEKVKSLNQLNKARDMALASYITVKSAILSTLETADDLCEARQALYNWEQEHEGAAQTILPKGYLDAWSDRYADPVKGASQFRKDSQEAKAASATLAQKKLAYERALAKAQEKINQEKGATVEQTPAQMGSGGGQIDPKLPADWQESVNGLKKTLLQLASDKLFVKSEMAEKVPQAILRCDGALFQLLKDFHQSLKDKASDHASRPNEAAANLSAGALLNETRRVLAGAGVTEDTVTQGEPELPEVTEELTDEDMKNIADVEATGTDE